MGDDIPQEVQDIVCGLAYAAAGANVIMQLARPPIGRTVALSTVDSGRVDKHPIKRLRTTSAYLAIAMLGSEEERRAMREETNRAHRAVGSPATFDAELQLWVAACLYKGLEDIWRLVYGGPVPAVLYEHGARLGTTLQVPAERWPADRAAFDRYWAAGVAAIAMDDVSRPYLQGIASATFLGPLARPLAPLSRTLTLGFLPEPFRDELGLPWTPRQQRAFDALVRAGGIATRLSPRALRQLPFNLYLADTRRRIRRGRAIV